VNSRLLVPADPRSGEGAATRTALSAPAVVVAILAVVYAAVYSWLAIRRHEAFQSHAFDLGNMDQAVWNTLHGHLLRFTDMAVGNHVLTTRLAIHVEPTLVLLAPLYLIHSGPETLLVVQAVVVSSGACAAYLLARRASLSPWVSLVFPIAYELHPSLQNALLDDFHAVTLSAALLLWALYFAFTGSTAGFAISAVLAAGTKENVGLLIAMIGVALVLRGCRAGWAALVLGIAWFLIAVQIIIPAFNPGGSPYLGRYSYLGHGLWGIARSVVTNPGLVLGTLLSPARLGYLGDLLSPLAFVPVLGLPVLLLATPSLAINMLSADPRMYSGFYQYSAEILPFVVAAGIAAVSLCARLKGQTTRRVVSGTLAGLILVASAVSTYIYGFSPLASGFVIPSAGPHQAIEQRILASIPADAVVSAADEIEPHVSDRQTVYMLPTIHPRNGPRAKYLVLDATTASLPVTPGTLHRVAERALQHGYGIVAADDGVLLLKSGASNRRLPPTFWTWIYDRPARETPEKAHWGGLALTGVVVHPASREVNRSRPAISVEAVWFDRHRLSSHSAIRFYLSPVYNGPHPAFSAAWTSEGDSPTWDWLPIQRWPAGREIVASSLSLLPPVGRSGKVDVAIGVAGNGPAQRAGAERVSGQPKLVRIATVEVAG